MPVAEAPQRLIHGRREFVLVRAFASISRRPAVPALPARAGDRKGVWFVHFDFAIGSPLRFLSEQSVANKSRVKGMVVSTKIDVKNNTKVA